MLKVIEIVKPSLYYDSRCKESQMKNIVVWFQRAAGTSKSMKVWIFHDGFVTYGVVQGAASTLACRYSPNLRMIYLNIRSQTIVSTNIFFRDLVV